MNSFTVVAEIGCTHIGDIDRANHLIRLAKESKADVAKFQKRNPYECVPKSWWDKPHPNKMFAYGDTYLEHRLNLELSAEQHKELKKYCEDIGIIYSTSVWDMTSAKEIVELNPEFIKVPSACNNNLEMIDYLFENYKNQVHISLGMTTEYERFCLVERYIEKYPTRCVFYHCVSGYPVPFEKQYLEEIRRLNTDYDLETHQIGYSNHGLGIALEPAAYILGARYFERHFTDSRVFLHTDAACSLEPQGLSKLARNLRVLETSLRGKPKDLDPIEQEQRDKLRNK